MQQASRIEVTGNVDERNEATVTPQIIEPGIEVLSVEATAEQPRSEHENQDRQCSQRQIRCVLCTVPICTAGTVGVACHILTLGNCSEIVKSDGSNEGNCSKLFKSGSFDKTKACNAFSLLFIESSTVAAFASTGDPLLGFGCCAVSTLGTLGSRYIYNRCLK